jgi:hypothetical protein
MTPFTKNDPRINKLGRPQGSFDVLKTLAQAILSEPARDKHGRIIVGPAGTPLSNLDVLLRKWVASGDFLQERHVMEIGYGKVPNPIALTDRDGNTQPLTMLEVVKDYGDRIETLRAASTGTDVSASIAGLLEDTATTSTTDTTEHAGDSSIVQDDMTIEG